ncbi:hypothetical protein FRC04_001203 [Tulasnella sp. 424]|nr:hypothetical protein FRC04_001203 [Tulasnella sp. 424]KAG8975777.1 hypothetical protein FRC05_004987 [Tulasnella sp. 425]
MLGLTTAHVVLVLLFGAKHVAALSNISLQGNFDQCQPPPILTWQADVIDNLKPPFHFFLVPIQASIPGHNNLLLKIPSTDKTWNATSRIGTFDALPTFPLSVGTRALAVISDSNGLGGASVPFTVGSSSNSTCLTQHPITSPSTSSIFAIQSAVTQCQPLTISWDPSNLRRASTNISVRGFVPGGATLNLGSSPASSGTMESTAEIPHGTRLVLAFTSLNDEGSETLLETSSMITVLGDDKSGTACLPKSSTARSDSKPVSHLFDGTHRQSSFQVPGMKRGAGDNIPLIVGLCIGGLALLTLSGFLLYLWRERLQYGVELGRSSPYHHPSSQFPSTPETSWMTPPQSQRQTGLSSSISQSPGDLEKALGLGDETGGEEITSRDRTSRRKGKEKERPRQQQGRYASSSTSKSNPHLLPPLHLPQQRPPGPHRGLSMGSTSSSSGPAAFDDIALPDLNLDALNTVEPSDLFTAPALAGSSPSSSSRQPLSSSFGSAGGSTTTTPAPSKRRKDSKRPRYEEVAMPSLNMDALNTVEASDLFTAPASLAPPPPSMVFGGSSSPSPSSTLSKAKQSKGDREKKKSRKSSGSVFLDVPGSMDSTSPR